MKKIFLILIIQFFVALSAFCDAPKSIISNKDIGSIAGNFLEGKLDFENPVFVDVDKDGDFDALKFDGGNVEYYKNAGTDLNPAFILENKNYDKYSKAMFIDPQMPYPIFLADKDGDGDMDLFVIKDKEYNKQTQKFEYKVTGAENKLNLDTGTLITIILVLVIVLLVLAILK